MMTSSVKPSATKCMLGRALQAATLLGGWFVLFAPLANGEGQTVAQAIKHSQQTGKPIFAVAGASYCPSCHKLLSTLNTDESLRPYLEQFVPLKINAQSDDYKRWKQFFPPKRAAIPALFIVTPQGQELYSAVGALPTQSLQKVMLTSLEKAERYPTKEQWKEITTTLKSAHEALEKNQLEEATVLLQPLFAKLVQMGSLLELSDAGRQTVEQVKELAAKQQALLDEALQSLVSKSDLQSALQVASLENLLEALPEQRKSAAVAIKAKLRNADLKKLLRQAQELQQAEALTHQSDTKSQRKAVALFKRIAKRYPDTEAAERAEQKLQTLAN